MNEDKQLYKEFLDGRQEAFDELIDKYLEKIIYFIYGFVRRIDIAEDLAQDVFVYILMNRENYNFKYSLKSYLYRIAKCRAYNYLKSSHYNKEVLIEDYNNYEDIMEIEEIVFNKIKNRNLRKAILKLNPKQSRVIYLSKIEELKIKDIAKILDLSENDVKISIHRGMKNLRKQMEKEEDLYV